MEHTFGIIGTGRTARAMAAYLMEKKLPVVMWGRSRKDLSEFQEHGIQTTGCIEGTFYPETETDIGVFCGKCRWLLVMTTAGGHKEIALQLKGSLREYQRILIFNGNWGAYEFFQVLGDELKEKRVLLGETGGMLLIADYVDGHCHMKSIKNEMSAAAFPGIQGQQMICELKDVFPQLKEKPNILETSLNNSNPFIHIPIVLFNYTRIENGEKFYFYRQGATESAVRCIEAADLERKKVLEKIGIQFESCLEIINSFWPDKKSTLYEAIRCNATYLSAIGPVSLDYRYMTEDLPYGIMTTAALGKLYQVDTPVLDSMITMYRCLMGKREIQCPVLIQKEHIEFLLHEKEH